MKAPTMNLYPDMGGAVQAGYKRTDLPLIHALIRAKEGEAFNPATHWPCEVCDLHGFTLEDFHAQWPTALEAARKQGAVPKGEASG